MTTESGVPTPPYEKGDEHEIQQDPISRSSGENVPPPGLVREPSAEEESGMSSTDTEARTPLGVGESVTRRGEDVVRGEGKEPGRKDVGTSGEARRPVGTSTERDSTTIDGQGTIEDESPERPAGN